MTRPTLTDLRKMDTDELERLRSEQQKLLEAARDEKKRIGGVIGEKAREGRRQELELQQQAIVIELEKLED
jgi:F0F1-type ATP synthase membrane subunit b/b'